MSQVNIQSIQVSNDDINVTGEVNGIAISGHTWLSHLYPPKSQDPISAARGCQNDTDRINHLSDILANAAGFGSKQELTATIEQALTVLITKPDILPIIIDPTVDKVVSPKL